MNNYWTVTPGVLWAIHQRLLPWFRESQWEIQIRKIHGEQSLRGHQTPVGTILWRLLNTWSPTRSWTTRDSLTGLWPVYVIIITVCFQDIQQSCPRMWRTLLGMRKRRWEHVYRPVMFTLSSSEIPLRASPHFTNCQHLPNWQVRVIDLLLFRLQKHTCSSLRR